MTQAILHTLNQSPFTSQLLAQCLARIASSDSLLLLEDGVYGALKNQPHSEAIGRLSSIYVIKEDVIARGLREDQLIENAQLISYDQWVELCVSHPLSHSWY